MIYHKVGAIFFDRIELWTEPLLVVLLSSYYVVLTQIHSSSRIPTLLLRQGLLGHRVSAPRCFNALT